MPDVLSRLASALDRNDERPNVELAEELAAPGNDKAIRTLVDALSTGSVAVQNDAIKVLYEIGLRNHDALAPYPGAFLALLTSKNNRNVWGALQAIDAIAHTDPDLFMSRLPEILEAADKGSVIAKDKAMSILRQLAHSDKQATVLPIFLDRLRTSAPNQFPMYAEIGVGAMDAAHREHFVSIIQSRLGKFAPAKQKRLEKVLKTLSR